MFDAADEAYARQAAFDNQALTLTERGYQRTKTIPKRDTVNPRRTYYADEPQNAEMIDETPQE